MAVGFQSIGVTKDWRPWSGALSCGLHRISFQSIGVTKDWRPLWPSAKHDLVTPWFQINRRQQRLATKMLQFALHSGPRFFQSTGVTKYWRLNQTPFMAGDTVVMFPINRRHQGLATVTTNPVSQVVAIEFPINRRHQRLATYGSANCRKHLRVVSFQSIGVTKVQ